jgi:hypothetical protein
MVVVADGGNQKCETTWLSIPLNRSRDGFPTSTADHRRTPIVGP